MKTISTIFPLTLVMALLGACDGKNFATKSDKSGGENSADQSQDGDDALQASDDGKGNGGSDKELSPEDRNALEKQCAKADYEETIHVNGDHGSLTTEVSRSTRFIVNGNQGYLDILNLTGEVAAICLFVRGNEATVSLNTDKPITKLMIVQRGNQNNVTVAIDAPAKVQNLLWSASGNQNHLAISGSGEFTCPTSKENGNETSLDCRSSPTSLNRR